jgi:hypothetical protein
MKYVLYVKGSKDVSVYENMYTKPAIDPEQMRLSTVGGGGRGEGECEVDIPHPPPHPAKKGRTQQVLREVLLT